MAYLKNFIYTKLGNSNLTTHNNQFYNINAYIFEDSMNSQENNHTFLDKSIYLRLTFESHCFHRHA